LIIVDHRHALHREGGQKPSVGGERVAFELGFAALDGNNRGEIAAETRSASRGELGDASR
jgi:hypothetical protein